MIILVIFSALWNVNVHGSRTSGVCSVPKLPNNITVNATIDLHDIKIFPNQTIICSNDVYERCWERVLWKSLRTCEKILLNVFGWNKVTWSSSVYGQDTERFKIWTDLSAHQQEAARYLGYSASLWNKTLEKDCYKRTSIPSNEYTLTAILWCASVVFVLCIFVYLLPAKNDPRFYFRNLGIALMQGQPLMFENILIALETLIPEEGEIVFQLTRGNRKQFTSSSYFVGQIDSEKQLFAQGTDTKGKFELTGSMESTRATGILNLTLEYNLDNNGGTLHQFNALAYPKKLATDEKTGEVIPETVEEWGVAFFTYRINELIILSIVPDQECHDANIGSIQSNLAQLQPKSWTYQEINVAIWLQIVVLMASVAGLILSIYLTASDLFEQSVVIKDLPTGVMTMFYTVVLLISLIDLHQFFYYRRVYLSNMYGFPRPRGLIVEFPISLILDLIVFAISLAFGAIDANFRQFLAQENYGKIGSTGNFVESAYLEENCAWKYSCVTHKVFNARTVNGFCPQKIVKAMCISYGEDGDDCEEVKSVILTILGIRLFLNLLIFILSSIACFLIVCILSNVEVESMGAKDSGKEVGTSLCLINYDAKRRNKLIFKPSGKSESKSRYDLLPKASEGDSDEKKSALKRSFSASDPAEIEMSALETC